jgi:hypothetical protein
MGNSVGDIFDKIAPPPKGGDIFDQIAPAPVGKATSVGRAPMGYLEAAKRTMIPALPKPTREDWRLFGHKLSQDVAGAAPAVAGTVAGALGTPAAGIAAAGGTQGGLDVVRELAPATAPWLGAGPRTSAEALKRSAGQAAAMGAQELGAAGLKAAGRFLVPVRTAGSEAAERAGVDLTPGQRVKGGAARLGLRLTEGGQAAQDYFATQAGQVIGKFGEIADQIGLPKADVDVQTTPLYKEIDDMTRGRPYTPIKVVPGGTLGPPGQLTRAGTVRGWSGYVSPTAVPGSVLTNPAPVNIKGTRRLVLRMFHNLDEIVNKKGMIPGYDSSQAAELLRKLKNGDPRITFGEAQKLRSLALMLQRAQTDVFPGETKAVTRALVGEEDKGGITAAMKRAAQLYDRQHPGSGLLNKWQTAQRIWREGVQRQRFSDFVDKSVRAPIQGEQTAEFVDARNLYSRYQKLTPAEKDLAVPPTMQPKFENLLQAAMQTDRPGVATVPRSVTAALLSFARTPVFNAMNSNAGRALLTRGWRVAAGTPEAAALATRIVAGQYLDPVKSIETLKKSKSPAIRAHADTLEQQLGGQ